MEMMYKDVTGPVFAESIELEESTLIIKELPFPGHTPITCVGQRKTSDMLSYRSKGVDLIVKGLPRAYLTVEPRSCVLPGETVTFKCDIKSDSGWTYKWYKDWSPNLVFESKEDTFIITAAESDKGLYWCQGERQNRPISSDTSRYVRLDVEVKPKLTQNKDYRLLKGESVTLICELGVSGLVFYWYKDTQASAPVAQTDVSSYSIGPLQLSHGGQYWCRAQRNQTVYHTQYSNGIWVNVTGGNMILEAPVHPLSEGDPLTLRCIHRNRPLSIRGDIYKDGLPLNQMVDGEMTIHSVMKDHEGRYHGQQQQDTNRSSNQGQTQPTDTNQDPSEYAPLQRGTSHVYETIIRP
ncbi:hypothetical protein ACEWY4_008044 [Coilia grayii]|uniref:Ig-like domain-containing protein n=1 Tax=Coilia grayii TaxID=363190 RepID=A0ABD1KA28_9TELE